MDLFRSIPKAEIHLHLEGSVALPTLLDILARRGEPADGAVRARLATLYTHRDFPHFLRNFRDLCSVFRRAEEFAVVTAALSDRLRADGVRYAEVFCSPGIFTAAGIAAAEILDAASGAARAREREGGPRLRFLLDGVRQFGIAALENLVESADAFRRYDVVGIGLGGDERAFRTAVFGPVYREARRRGLRTTVHAGEFDGPRSVWEAIEVLEAERIGHGVRATEDAELLRVLARLGVPLECCPTSNVRTGVVRRWEEHPIRVLRDAGVAVTVNSDDPAMFGTTLAGEWEALVTRLGFTAAETVAVGIRTARAAFLPEAEKMALIEAMRRASAQAGIEP